ncbi:unnamed protein product, partial [Polarella glacialis]
AIMVDSAVESLGLPVKNTFIHFTTGESCSRALRRWRTDPTDDTFLLRAPQDELKEEEEDTCSITPRRSSVGSSTAACSSAPPSPSGADTPETPLGTPGADHGLWTSPPLPGS